MELQMVQSGAHKCGRKSESQIEEEEKEKTIPEVRKLNLETLSVFSHL
jgi:hypothetical protein